MDEDSVDRITTKSRGIEASAFIGGFVAAEGCFTRGTQRFRFAVALGATDLGMLRLIKNVLGVGTIRRYERRQPHFDDEVVFAVTSRTDLVTAIVPFMDRWLPESYKREQYLAWRADLLRGGN